MRTYMTLVTKETAGILKSPPILFATGFFVLLDAFAFYLTTARAGAPLAEFDEIAMFILFSSIFLYPVVAMNLFAENNADGTIETLLTAPVSAIAAILAKFAAGMIFVLLHLVHALVFAILLDYGGNLDWQATAAGFIALFAFGLFAMSLGVFVSSLTVSQAAAAGTGGVLVFLAIAADLDPYSGHTADVLHSMSYFPHARRWIAGQVDVRGIIYFLSTTVFFLFAAWLAITNREPQKRASNPTVRRRLAVTYLLVMAGVVLVLTQGAILHITGFWESGMPLGPALARVPWSWLVPLLLAAGAFFWSILTFRAAKRAERGARGKKSYKYATISDTAVMRAPRYYYEENVRARRRVVVGFAAALVVLVNVNWLSHYPWRTFQEAGRHGGTSPSSRTGHGTSPGKKAIPSPTPPAASSILSRAGSRSIRSCRKGLPCTTCRWPTKCAASLSASANITRRFPSPSPTPSPSRNWPDASPPNSTCRRITWRASSSPTTRAAALP